MTVPDVIALTGCQGTELTVHSLHQTCLVPAEHAVTCYEDCL